MPFVAFAVREHQFVNLLLCLIYEHLSAISAAKRTVQILIRSLPERLFAAGNLKNSSYQTERDAYYEKLNVYTRSECFRDSFTFMAFCLRQFS